MTKQSVVKIFAPALYKLRLGKISRVDTFRDEEVPDLVADEHWRLFFASPHKVVGLVNVISNINAGLSNQVAVVV